MTAADYAKARRVLARRDRVIRDLMRQFGECGLARAQRTDPFRALLHAIIAQQLSTKAAATIEARFAAVFDGRPTAAAMCVGVDWTGRWPSMLSRDCQMKPSLTR